MLPRECRRGKPVKRMAAGPHREGRSSKDVEVPTRGKDRERRGGRERRRKGPRGAKEPGKRARRRHGGPVKERKSHQRRRDEGRANQGRVNSPTQESRRRKPPLQEATEKWRRNHRRKQTDRHERHVTTSAVGDRPKVARVHGVPQVYSQDGTRGSWSEELCCAREKACELSIVALTSASGSWYIHSSLQRVR